MDGWIHRYMDGQTDKEIMDGLINRQTDGWMDG
jgi:hypothetical protein